MVPTAELVASWYAHLLVYGVGVGYFAVLAIVLVRRAQRAFAQAAEADASMTPSALREGPAIIRGVVEYGDGADAAVRVELEQVGTEQESSGSWFHAWREVDRRLHVQPFVVRMSTGEGVVVDPDSRVILADALDGITSLDAKRRVRVAQLTPGEEVLVRGVLTTRNQPGAAAGSGYRDIARVWAMEPAPGERMLISTEALGSRFREAGRGLRRRVLVVIAVAALAQLSWLDFHARAFLGEAMGATVVRTYTTIHTDSDGDRIAEHFVEFDPDVGPRRTLRGTDLDRGLEPGTRIGWIFVSAWPLASALGGANTAHGVQHTIVIVAFLALSFVAFNARARRWYEGASIHNSGRGRLSAGHATGTRDRHGVPPP